MFDHKSASSGIKLRLALYDDDCFVWPNHDLIEEKVREGKAEEIETKRDRESIERAKERGQK